MVNANSQSGPEVKDRSAILRKLLPCIMLAVFVLSFSIWYFTRETLPSEIRIATAEKGGLYYKLASVLQKDLEKRTGRPVRLLETRGSVENRELFLAGKADLAIMQAGAFPMDGLSALAPLYPDVVHVIARKDRGLESIRDFHGKNVSLGPPGSAMRESAIDILSHYGVHPETLGQKELYFSALHSKASLDAAIVTTGFLNPDLNALLKTGDFKLIPILDAEALAIHHAYFSPITIPRGLFKEGPPVPEEPVVTVATVAFLAAREDVSELLVTGTLSALYNGRVRLQIPTLISARDAANWPLYPLHQASRSYYEPYRDIDVLANFVESLAGIKELLFALGAGVYLLWYQWHRIREREIETAFRLQRKDLDDFLNQTARIEKAQMHTDDPKQLKKYLDEITRIKLQALEEFTDENMRTDSLFSIFLIQCANLKRSIESKIIRSGGGASGQ
jgi:TRAP transporter TAXI family solute receptor